MGRPGKEKWQAAGGNRQERTLVAAVSAAGIGFGAEQVKTSAGSKDRADAECQKRVDHTRCKYRVFHMWRNSNAAE